MSGKRSSFVVDVGIVVVSIVVAIILARGGALEKLLASTQEMRFLGSFVAGIFFVSVFTAAPAVVALGEIARSNSALTVALLGGLGALVGDVVIFRFVKDRVAEKFLDFARRSRLERMNIIFRHKSSRWIVPLLGALIIASPLPDEIGVAMLGLSNMKNSRFIVVSLLLNAAGIYVIGILAKSF